MCVNHILSPATNAKAKVEHIYTGPSESEIAETMGGCDMEVSYMFAIVLVMY